MDLFQNKSFAAAADIGSPGVIIAIASSIEERVRLARLLGCHAPVMLVASREEAVALLGAADPPAPPPTVLPVAPVFPVAPARSRRPGVEVDSDWRTATWAGRSVALSPLEHDLLVCLLEEVGHTVTFGELHRRVWGNDHLGDHSDVQSVVKRLRRKLADLQSPVQIQAVRGVGLRLVDANPPPPTTVVERLSLPGT